MDIYEEALKLHEENKGKIEVNIHFAISFLD